MAELPDLDRYELIDLITNALNLSVSWEEVGGRYVPCDQPTPNPVPRVCPAGGSWSSYQGRHEHWTRYEKPHRRLVVRLPAEPVEVEGTDR